MFHLVREGLFTDTVTAAYWTVSAFWKAGAWLQQPVKSPPNEKTGSDIENTCLVNAL